MMLLKRYYIIIMPIVLEYIHLKTVKYTTQRYSQNILIRQYLSLVSVNVQR